MESFQSNLQNQKTRNLVQTRDDKDLGLAADRKLLDLETFDFLAFLVGPAASVFLVLFPPLMEESESESEAM